MNTYKGLKVPEITLSHDKCENTRERQDVWCVTFQEHCDFDCKKCIYCEENIKVFEQWEKDNE